MRRKFSSVRSVFIDPVDFVSEKVIYANCSNPLNPSEENALVNPSKKESEESRWKILDNEYLEKIGNMKGIISERNFLIRKKNHTQYIMLKDVFISVNLKLDFVPPKNNFSDNDVENLSYLARTSYLFSGITLYGKKNEGKLKTRISDVF